MLQPLQVRSRPKPEDVPYTLVDFLRQLAAPTWFECRGMKPGPARVVVCLLHGNEPSGARALHQWLRSDQLPIVEAHLLFASVQTALAEPLLSHRQLPGQPDANRVFRPPFEGPVASAARAILERLERLQPEALVDLHNNTGRNPPYGVGFGDSPRQLNLTRLFADRYMYSDLSLGALVETTAPRFTSVAIECGKTGDPVADAVALAGVDRFLSTPDLSLGAPPSGIRVLARPVRVQVRPGVRLHFGATPHPDADLTLISHIDRHNFEPVQAGERIGWCRPDPLPVIAMDASGADRAHELFAVESGWLCTRRTMVPVMMTLDPRIAVSDCLFYAMLEEREHE